MKTVHLGFELNSGLSVELPLHHLVVCGMTRSSGKTTTLEALISRTGMSSIVFLTKRGEEGFENGRTIRPFFRPAMNWMYVQSLLESTAQEKLKADRGRIIEATTGARTLYGVHKRIQRLQAKSKGSARLAFQTLSAYFDMLLPEIDAAKFSKTLRLKPGLNVMRLESLRSDLQSMVIASTVDEVYKNHQGTITVIPECWRFLQRGKGSPVKTAVNNLIRQGAVLRNFCWLDTQDTSAVDSGILKSVDVWLVGRQRELNEIRRMVDQIPVRPKPRPNQIATLGVGQFVACFGSEVKTVYVQPAWMSWGDAQSIATGFAARTR